MAGTDHRRKSLRGFVCVAAVMAVASCDVSPVYKNPAFPFAGSFAAKPSGSPVLLDNVAWWTRFNDPTLNKLIDQALSQNLDLELARERVTEAQALVGTIPDQLSTNGDVSGGRRGGKNVSDSNGGDGSFGFDWLFDPYGGRRAQVRASESRVEAAEADLDAARLLLLSNVAIAYVDLRFYQTSLRLRREELSSRQSTMGLFHKLQERGAASRLDVVRAEALVSETQSLIPNVQAAIRVQQNRIAVLLGRTPGRPDSALLGGGKGQPVSKMPADIGVPADLLRNRPDIRVAERSYYAAVAEIGAARAALYPSLSLGGEISLQAFGPLNTRNYFFGPTLRLPPLPNGPQKAAIKVRESRARQALTDWQSMVLTAIEEVESALAEYSGSLTSVSASRKTVRLYNESIGLTRELIGRGGATVRDLLDDEQSVAVANILLSQNLRQLGQDFVIVNVSLGSGNGYGAKENAARSE